MDGVKLTFHFSLLCFFNYTLYRAFLFFEVEIALYIVHFYQYSILSSFSIHSSKALIASSWSNTSDGSLRFSGFSSNSS